MRLIDADNLKAKMETTLIYALDMCVACGVIDDEPTVDATPIVHAHWIEKAAISVAISSFEYKSHGVVSWYRKNPLYL